MFCGLIIHQHMPKELIFFGMTKKFVEIHRTKNHRPKITAINKKNTRIIIESNTEINLLPYLGLGIIITFSSYIASNEKIYNITHCNFSSCVCFHYGSMNNTSIGKCGMYINCKYLYYIFHYLCKLDYKKVTFIHAPTFSSDEVKQVFFTAGIIKTCE